MSRDPIWLLWFHEAGVFRPANARENQAVIDKAAGIERQTGARGEQYVPMKAMLTLGRRKRHHDALFAYIGDAFENWPHSHPFRPDSAEHLRAWLLVEAGHSTVDLMLVRTSGEVAAVAAFNEIERRRARWSFPKITEQREGTFGVVGYDIEVRTALTIRWDALDETEFKKVSGPVFDLIANVWMDFDAWKKLKGTHEKS
jgi:hypothetical protein